MSENLLFPNKKFSSEIVSTNSFGSNDLASSYYELDYHLTFPRKDLRENNLYNTMHPSVRNISFALCGFVKIRVCL